MSTSAPKSHPYRHVARVVIEFTTPFHVGTGEGGYGADALVVTDANGLPAIPGSSLAGALRAAFLAQKGDPSRADCVFGHQTGDQGCGSRLSLTWAAIHNAKDEPLEGLRAHSCLESDPVLNEAFGLRLRDHVRLTHRGAADTANRGKFDDSPVAAGHRFTFELELVSAQEDDPDWNDLLATLTSGALRLGGKSRRGYGAFKVVRLHAKTFNLANEDDFNAYAKHPASLSQPAPALAARSLSTNLGVAASRQSAASVEAPITALSQDAATPASPGSGRAAESIVTITLRLKPRGYWMFGGGEDQPSGNAKPADMAPLREERIVWDVSTGTVREKCLLLPGSAIKGALSHRVAFHYNRLAEKPQFADQIAAHCGNDQQGHDKADEVFRGITGINNQAVRELFGYVAEGKDTDAAGQAARGRVLIDDLFWAAAEPRKQLVPHVSIDRFTGGASDSKLFSERPLWQGDFPDLTLTILQPAGVSPAARQALKAALDDLAEGRLALGAGAGRGLGYFEPKAGAQPAIECSAGDAWFNPAPATPTPSTHATA